MSTLFLYPKARNFLTESLEPGLTRRAPRPKPTMPVVECHKWEGLCTTRQGGVKKVGE